MRKFYSYGSPNEKKHFVVPRTGLIEACVSSLVDEPEEGGHYFTIWAPRQTGKTWLMQQAIQQIKKKFSEQFTIGHFSTQGLDVEEEEKPIELFLKDVPNFFEDAFDLNIDTPQNWHDWKDLFHKKRGVFSKPVILFIDEFDNLPEKLIHRLVSIFRDIYLHRKDYHLHGLALIGVRSVLGIDSTQGSPFNIQQSLEIPNLTQAEVSELYHQYQEKSEQIIESEVVEKIFLETRGQPGIVSWLGELLTVKHNPKGKKQIGMTEWEQVLHRAQFSEPNNNLMNLISKARKEEYREFLFRLFVKEDIPFSFHNDSQSYLYMHGVLTFQEKMEKKKPVTLCQFSSPFIQRCLFDSLRDMIQEDRQVALHEPLDDFSDVLDGPGLNLPALIQRYRDYLKRLTEHGINPWKDQPRRVNLNITEAVGHFHLFSWLQRVIGKECLISPEFPTGNGRVDLLMEYEGKKGILEIKSFGNLRQIEKGKQQASQYAQKLGLQEVTLVLFAPFTSNASLEHLSGSYPIGGNQVHLEIIGVEV